MYSSHFNKVEVLSKEIQQFKHDLTKSESFKSELSCDFYKIK